jgi:uncharacterized protein YciI
MKNISLLIISLIVLNISSYCQKDTASKKTEPNIKQFWLVVLKTGPQDKIITDTTERKKIFAGHFSNMEKLHSEGILKAAGPFGKNDFSWRGLFILDCKTREDAETYVKTDPAISAGVFIVDIVPWYSEASGSFVSGKPKKEN